MNRVKQFLNYTIGGEITKNVLGTLLASIVLALPAIVSSDYWTLLIRVINFDFPVYYYLIFSVLLYSLIFALRRKSIRKEKVGHFTYMELVDILQGEKTKLLEGKVADENLLVLFISMCVTGALSRPISAQDSGSVNNLALRVVQRLAVYDLVREKEQAPPKGSFIAGVQYTLSRDGKKFYALIRRNDLANRKRQAKLDAILSYLETLG